MSHSHSHSHSHSCSSEHTGGAGGDDHHHHHHHTHDHNDEHTPHSHQTLYSVIDHSRIQTLNEQHPNSGRDVILKSWTSRLDPTPVLYSSDSDPQLIIHIPFTAAQVKLHSILLRFPSNSPSGPRLVRLFKNRLDLDFAAVEDDDSGLETQRIEIPRELGPDGVIEVPVKRALWTGVTGLSIFFVDNWGKPWRGGHGSDSDYEEDEEGDEVSTEISYLGLKGDWFRTGGAPLGLVYESAANPADHKLMKGVDWKGGVGLGGKSGSGKG